MTVELLGGRGEELWPWPGRVLAVGPAHTFADVANAINDAFGRWDRSHLSMFTLADGRLVADGPMGAELVGSVGGPVVVPLDIRSAEVIRVVEPGTEFRFTFDLGDGWTHRCVVAKQKIDPVEVLGTRPGTPLPYGGWGTIPDQHGRQWASDDDEGRPPRRPSQTHLMLLPGWPAPAQVPTLDLLVVRQSIAGDDAARFLAWVTSCDVDDALQQVGAGLPMALRQRRDQAEPVVLSVIDRLTRRGGPGDQVLAEDLVACLRREPLPGRAVPVDLELLSAELEGDLGLSSGGYVDLCTGEVFDDSLTDPMVVGEDVAIDVDEDPDRWLRFDRTGARDGWRDMSDFVQRQRDARPRERLERAVHGAGAFRRFRDVVHDEDLTSQWHAYVSDRRLGRARAFLAGEGIRVVS